MNLRLQRIISILLFVLLLAVSTSLHAQDQARLNFQLRTYLEKAPANEPVHLLVKGHTAPMRQYVKKHGGIFKRETNGFGAIMLPAGKVSAFSKQPFVEYIEFSLEKGRTMNDAMRVNNNVDSVHQGLGVLNMSYTGKDVVLGFIDTGIEILHPDFLMDTVNNNTRVIAIWDQNLTTPGQIPAEYGYGTLWDSTHINAGACTHTDSSGHGTTVAGSGCANGLAGGNNAGVAPEADIVIVDSDFENPNWKATVADAVDYIYDVADSLGKPCVINASLGSYLGPHDGKDAAAQFIDSMILAKRGRSLVCAAGNSGTIPYHLGYDVTTDTSWTWFQVRNAGSGSQFQTDAVFFEVWSDTADFNNVEYAVGADQVTGGYSKRGSTSFYNVSDHLFTTVSDTITNNGNVLGVVQYWAELQGDRYLLQVYLEQPDSSQYNFRFMTTGAGHLDVWADDWLGISKMVSSGLPTVAQFPDVVNYQLPDAHSTIVDSWNCSPHTISVGQYINRTSYVDYNMNTQNGPGTVGELHFSSSSGPARTGLVKPDITASGNVAMSSAPFDLLAWSIVNQPFKVSYTGMHMRNGGTSMASPVVAGVAALYLEKCPTASAAEIKDALLNTTKIDSFTGGTPNMSYGYGKVDAYRALVYTQFEPILTVVGDSLFCDGDSVEFIAPAGYASYEWSTGDTTSSIFVTATDSVQVQVWDAASCHGVSRWYHVEALPSISASIVSTAADTLFGSSGTSYQWHLNGAPIAGATSQNHVAQNSGWYALQVFNMEGCFAFSDSVYLSVTGVEELLEAGLLVYPNPVDEYFIVGLKDGHLHADELTLYATDGSVVSGLEIVGYSSNDAWVQVNLGGLSPGVYLLTVRTDNRQYRHKIIVQ